MDKTISCLKYSSKNQHALSCLDNPRAALRDYGKYVEKVVYSQTVYINCPVDTSTLHNFIILMVYDIFRDICRKYKLHVI